MAQIDDGALKSLQTILREIAWRANCLSVWMDLERALLVVDRKFDEIYDHVLDAVGPPPNFTPATQGQLKLQLRNFRTMDFAEFDRTAAKLVTLYQKVTPGVQGNPGAQVKAWADGLKGSLEQVQKYLNEASTQNLASTCDQLQTDLKGYLIDRRNLMIDEVDTLSDLTRRVQEKLGARDEPAPGAGGAWPVAAS